MNLTFPLRLPPLKSAVRRICHLVGRAEIGLEFRNVYAHQKLIARKHVDKFRRSGEGVHPPQTGGAVCKFGTQIHVTEPQVECGRLWGEREFQSCRPDKSLGSALFFYLIKVAVAVYAEELSGGVGGHSQKRLLHLCYTRFDVGVGVILSPYESGI